MTRKTATPKQRDPLKTAATRPPYDMTPKQYHAYVVDEIRRRYHVTRKIAEEQPAAHGSDSEHWQAILTHLRAGGRIRAAILTKLDANQRRAILHDYPGRHPDYRPPDQGQSFRYPRPQAPKKPKSAPKPKPKPKPRPSQKTKSKSKSKDTKTTTPEQKSRQLLRLGGEYERADQRHDYAAKVRIEHDIEAIGASMPESYAWWLTVIRGRNAIRRQHKLEPLHY